MEGPKCIWEITIKMDIKRMIYEVAEWINVARYIVQLWPLVNTVMGHCV